MNRYLTRRWMVQSLYRRRVAHVLPQFRHRAHAGVRQRAVGDDDVAFLGEQVDDLPLEVRDHEGFFVMYTPNLWKTLFSPSTIPRKTAGREALD